MLQNVLQKLQFLNRRKLLGKTEYDFQLNISCQAYAEEFQNPDGL